MIRDMLTGNLCYCYKINTYVVLRTRAPPQSRDTDVCEQTLMCETPESFQLQCEV